MLATLKGLHQHRLKDPRTAALILLPADYLKSATVRQQQQEFHLDFLYDLYYFLKLIRRLKFENGPYFLGPGLFIWAPDPGSCYSISPGVAGPIIPRRGWPYYSLLSPGVAGPIIPYYPPVWLTSLYTAYKQGCTSMR